MVKVAGGHDLDQRQAPSEVARRIGSLGRKGRSSDRPFCYPIHVSMVRATVERWRGVVESLDRLLVGPGHEPGPDRLGLLVGATEAQALDLLGLQLALHADGDGPVRDGAGKRLADAGVDVLYVAEMLGHSSPAITQSVYHHVRRDRLDAAMEAISGAIGR